MCTASRIDRKDLDDFADLRRPCDTTALRIAAGALIFGTLIASTTLYLRAMEAAASILLH
ncbi:MAG TPA: hypothetical protein PK812_09595 [Beijerinckiaceae bacterium]|nr:hypothetical protein [Beijerinckiaceae bacterium]